MRCWRWALPMGMSPTSVQPCQQAAGGVEPVLGLGPHPGRCLLQRRSVQGEVNRLPGLQGHPPVCCPALQCETDRCGEHQPLGAASRGDAAVDVGQQRDDQAVLRARSVGDIHLDLTGRALR